MPQWVSSRDQEDKLRKQNFPSIRDTAASSAKVGFVDLQEQRLQLPHYAETLDSPHQAPHITSTYVLLLLGSRGHGSCTEKWVWPRYQGRTTNKISKQACLKYCCGVLFSTSQEEWSGSGERQQNQLRGGEAALQERLGLLSLERRKQRRT